MKIKETRREFLKRASAFAIAFPVLNNCAVAQKSPITELEKIKQNADTSGANWSGAKDTPIDVSWKATFADKSEKGDRLSISGTIYHPDGKTPASNLLIYAYHTDIKGIYGQKGEPAHGRFRGWMLTDEKGRYSIDTIKPASYPNNTIAAHIHMTLTGKKFKEDWIDSILFEGDKYISARERKKAGNKGGFNPIIKLEKDSNGVLRGVRDISLLDKWA